MKSSRFLMMALSTLLVLSLSVSGVFALWIYYDPMETVSKNLDVGASTFYYDIAITDVSLISQSVSSETRDQVDDTIVQTIVTGSAGQTVVYQITAVNYSTTTTYVYDGAAVTSGGASISSSSDQGNQNRLPAVSNTTYTSGTPIEPGDTFTFYATYTLTGSMSSGEILADYNFTPVIYTVTYMDNNQIYAVDCITNGNAAYSVRKDHPAAPGANVKFEYWMNASGLKVTSYPAGNTNNYTLNAKWNNIYSIIFVVEDGSVVHQEHITVQTTALSAEGLAVVDAKLNELQAAVTEQDIEVKWSDYTFGSAGDIIVRPEYTYGGALKLVPVYDEGGVDDGILDYYKVAPLDTLVGEEHKDIVIPGMVGVPVKVIERVTNEAGDGDWNNFNDSIETIRIGEGVEELAHNSLSYTPKLNTVYLPSTLKSMGKNSFSRNTPSDNKKLTIYYAGTMADWEKLVANSDRNWDGGLKDNSIIICTDGYYVADTRELLGAVLSRTWYKHSHVNGTACPSGCPSKAPF